VLHGGQGNSLAVEHHHSVAQMHEQVFITIELLVQGRESRPLIESDAIVHSASL
jgi:hypothetical protein